MRLSVRLPPEAVRALDTLAAGRSRSDAVRDAILLAAQFEPVINRLDRIEAMLASGVAVTTAAPMQVTDDAEVAARQAVANLRAWGAGDDD